MRISDIQYLIALGDSSDDEQPKPKPMSGLTNQPPMLICVDEPPDDMGLELMVPPGSLMTRKKQV